MLHRVGTAAAGGGVTDLTVLLDVCIDELPIADREGEKRKSDTYGHTL